jgi:hypothetical protein
MSAICEHRLPQAERTGRRAQASLRGTPGWMTAWLNAPDLPPGPARGMRPDCDWPLALSTGGYEGGPAGMRIIGDGR